MQSQVRQARPSQEKEIGDTGYQFEDDLQIIERVREELAGWKDSEEVEGDGSEDSDGEVSNSEKLVISIKAVGEMCEVLEKSILTMTMEDGLELLTGLRRFRARLASLQFAQARQTTLVKA